MTLDFQWADTGIVYRYSRNTNASEDSVDGYRNFKHAFRSEAPLARSLQLERGINSPAQVANAGTLRRSVILLRSSPWKAGTETTPWYDSFDLQSGAVRYFGDGKPGDSSVGEHAARGNRVMLSVAHLYASDSHTERQLAPPIALFRGVPGELPGRGIVQKGFVEFVGIALLEAIHSIHQVDTHGEAFPNFEFALRLCPLENTDGRLDWNWINDRRDASLSASVANLRAPIAWRHWIETGELPTPLAHGPEIDKSRPHLPADHALSSSEATRP